MNAITRSANRMKSRALFGTCLFISAQVALVSHATAAEAWAIDASSQSARASSDFIHVTASLQYAGLQSITVDSLGKQRFPVVNLRPPAQPRRPLQARQNGSWLEYRRPGAPDSAVARWAIHFGRQELRFVSRWSAGDPPEPLTFELENLLCHVTLLGLMNKDGGVQLPCLMHFPD